jgi:L-2-hydroxyglutarate oxidase
MAFPHPSLLYQQVFSGLQDASAFMPTFDLIVVGGGIVGLATAYRFTNRYPGKRVVVLEKEAHVAEHQTGRNSGVLHSGIYYKPGSLKATNCRAGKKALEIFCANEGIAHEICGKVIVAVTDADLPALQRIYERGVANGVSCVLIDRARLAELEPFAAGVKAIHVPETGIVNYRQVCERLAEKVRAGEGQVICGAKVTAVQHHTDTVTASTPVGAFTARQLVNCAGLYSDRVARLTGRAPHAKIIPFRGEYFSLKPTAYKLCRNLIYPVPDPQFPFLGVHFTRMIDGSVECGPNAVLAFGREAYQFFSLNPRDFLETVTYTGFLRMATRHWRMGLGEMRRSLSKAAFVRALQRLVPAIQADDLLPAPAGIRAQAVADDGSLVDDFLILEGDRVVNVCNAPSPAATAALQIGDSIVDRIAGRFR